MDIKKTGMLISETRKERGLTQKQLAKQLHISDRTISKWERGVGFPDVSLLEPLAAILELNVLNLLRGEKTEESNVHAAVSEALAAFQEKQRQNRRYVLRALAEVIAFLLVLAILLSFMIPFKQDIDQTITAGIYHNGSLATYTDVEMKGETEHTLITGRRLYWGRFAIDCIPWTTAEQPTAEIYLGEQSGLGYMVEPGISSMSLYDPSTIMSLDMREFAFEVRCGEDEWYILATSPEAYKAYTAQRGGVPPLTSLKPASLPSFPGP